MKVYDTIELITSKFRADRKANNYLGLVEDGLALLEEVPKLIEISITQESLYRQFEARLADEVDEKGKKVPNTYCETMSKATDNYKEWQKAKQLIEYVYELVNMSKILARGVSKEFNAN